MQIILIPLHFPSPSRCYSFCNNMNFLGFINMLAFSLRVVLLNFADCFHSISYSCHIFCDNWFLLGLFKIVVFSLGVALLKFLDFFSYKHFKASFSIVYPIAAISSGITGSYLNCLKFLYLAWG